MISRLRQGKMTVPPLFNHILCTLDFDDDSLAALRMSKRLAERNGATLAIIHVMTPRVIGGVVLREDKEEARVGLEKIAANELGGLDYQIIVRWGNPAREIVAAESELGAQLCVMPINGRMGASHLFMKSITERVARNSLCPVLTVGARGA